MSDATFETFLVSGLLVLIAAVAYLAWSAWRWVDRERDMEQLALVGVGYELRYNLQRMMGELSRLSIGALESEIEIVPVVHPQLDALLTRPNEADRMGLTNIRAHYNELSAHKLSLKAALKDRSDIELPANIAADAVIESLATLYLWEEHKGRAPEKAHSTRSWAVRDWMKANKFHADSLPGLHLRDQVVERLRHNGMTLTPKPLTYSASEYFAKQYDRKADPNAPFWKRKKKVTPVPVVDVVGEADAEESAIETESVAAPEQALTENLATAPESEPPMDIAADAAPVAEIEPDQDLDTDPVEEPERVVDVESEPVAEGEISVDAEAEPDESPMTLADEAAEPDMAPETVTDPPELPDKAAATEEADAAPVAEIEPDQDLDPDPVEEPERVVDVESEPVAEGEIAVDAEAEPDESPMTLADEAAEPDMAPETVTDPPELPNEAAATEADALETIEAPSDTSEDTKPVTPGAVS